MVNTIWKENFLIMCSKLCLNARDSGHFAQLLLICRNFYYRRYVVHHITSATITGIAENLPLNRMLGDYDIIHGTFFVCGLTRDDFTDLTPKQMKHYGEMYHDPQLFSCWARPYVWNTLRRKATLNSCRQQGSPRTKNRSADMNTTI